MKFEAAGHIVSTLREQKWQTPVLSSLSHFYAVQQSC